MNKKYKFFFITILTLVFLFCSSCGTIISYNEHGETIVDNHRAVKDSPLIYSGTRMDTSTAWTSFFHSNSHPHQLSPDWLIGTFFLLDTPFSFLFDTIALPVTIPWAIYQKFQYPFFDPWSREELKNGQDKFNPIYKDKKLFPVDFIKIPKGCFIRGTKEAYYYERPQEKLCVESFSIAQFEVTQGQWMEIMGTNPSTDKSCGLDCPVENVTYNDVQEFIKKYNAKKKAKVRLPTESEWEYTAKLSIYMTFYQKNKDEVPSGNINLELGEDNYFSKDKWRTIKDYSWFDLNAKGKIYPVGRKLPLGLKIYDLIGNVAEIVQINKEEGPEDYAFYKGGSSTYELRSYNPGSRLFLSLKTESKANVGFRLAMNYL